jgi:hypothetical protein
VRSALARVALVGLLAGCGDPSVEVSFTIPEAYRPSVAEVRLRVLQPPAAEPFGCEEVARGFVGEDTVRLTSTFEIVVDAGSGEVDLSGIPRDGDKLFLAEGLDVDGCRLVAACASSGPIDRDLHIALEGEAGAALEVFEPDPLATTEVSPVLPGAVAVGIYDAFGVPLAGSDVAWRVIGPASGRTDGIAPVDGEGNAVLAAQATELAGPALVQLGPRWPIAEIPPLHFQQEPITRQDDVPMPVGDVPESERTLAAVGPIGPAGEMGFAVLGPVRGDITQAPAQGRVLVLGYLDGGQLALTEVPFLFGDVPLAELPNAVALVGDRVVLLAEARWYEADAAGVFDEGPLALAATPSFAVEAGACGGPARVVAEVNGALVLLDPAAGYAEIASGPFSGVTGIRLLGSGCVDDDDGNPHRVVAVTSEASRMPSICPDSALALVSDAGGGATLCLDQAVLPNVGFGGDEEPVLLFPSVGGDGAGVDAVLVSADADSAELYLTKLDRQATVLPALAMAAGDVDGDGALDLAASVVAEPDGDGFRQLLRIGLAVDYQGEARDAFLVETNGPVPFLWLGDLDDDGYDDLFRASTTQWGVGFFGERAP